MKPFIKWVGGKTQLLPELMKHVPSSFSTYFEPFLGGGALFFHMLPDKAVLSDVNYHLIRTYKGVTHDVEEVVKLLAAYSALHDEHMYYDSRSRLTTPDAWDWETAARFIYLNKTCFNGLWRVNKKGEMNTPIGKQKTLTICDADTLRNCSAALNRPRITILEASFESMLNAPERGDFVYFDPPYVPLKLAKSFTSYTSRGYCMKQHVKLRDVALALKKRGVHVLLSNSDTPLVRELYADDFIIHEVKARRSVNSKGSDRGKIKELIIT